MAKWLIIGEAGYQVVVVIILLRIFENSQNSLKNTLHCRKLGKCKEATEYKIYPESFLFELTYNTFMKMLCTYIYVYLKLGLYTHSFAACFNLIKYKHYTIIKYSRKAKFLWLYNVPMYGYITIHLINLPLLNIQVISIFKNYLK